MTQIIVAVGESTSTLFVEVLHNQNLFMMNGVFDYFSLRHLHIGASRRSSRWVK